MQRLTKAQMREYALTGIPVDGLRVQRQVPGSQSAPVETILPPGKGTMGELMSTMAFPPDVEKYFPTHSEVIIHLRSELMTKIDQLPHNVNNRHEQAKEICREYVGRMYVLCGEEQYKWANHNTPYIKEFLANTRHNIKMNKKLQEYQRRPCGNCTKTGPWKNCGRCHQIYYCGKECQTSHWSTHKPHCIPQETSTK